jgi:hypothetical protein
MLASGATLTPSPIISSRCNKATPQKLECMIKLYIHTHIHTYKYTPQNSQELMILRIRRFPITSDTKPRLKSAHFLRTYPLTSLATESQQDAHLDLYTHTTLIEAPKSSQHLPPQGNSKVFQRRLCYYS